ncbi:MAG: hypothetical protein HYX75_12910 [Acidobacteria bacterium]|nr:hypothetical protein [Acidobacteriota bacterium]
MPETQKSRRPQSVLTLTPTGVLKVLGGFVAVLIIASSLGQVVRFTMETGRRHGIVHLFYVGGEANIPTWYSATALFICAMLLALVASVKWRERDRYRHHWSILAAAFVYLSCDEAAQLHETGIEWLRAMLSNTRLEHVRWVVPATLVVVIFAAGYLRFLFSLPRKTARHFIMAGMLYVGGAVGLESLVIWRDLRYGGKSPGHVALTTLEELSEMAGVVLLIYALLHYLAAECDVVIGLGTRARDTRNGQT